MNKKGTIYKIRKMWNVFSDNIEIFFGRILILLMVVLLVLLGFTIILRYIFNISISWSNEFLRFTFIYIVFIGTAISNKQESHAKIEFIYNKSPKNLKHIFTIVNFTVMIFISLIFIILGINQVIARWHTYAPVMTFLPMGFVYLSIVICGCMTLIFVILKILNKDY